MVFSIHNFDVASDAVAAAIEVGQLLANRQSASVPELKHARRMLKSMYLCSLNAAPAKVQSYRGTGAEAQFLDRSTATALAVVFRKLDDSLCDVFGQLPGLIGSLFATIEGDVITAKDDELKYLERFFLELSEYAMGNNSCVSAR